MAWNDEISGDLRFAARSLARRPWFAALAILTLALGIGATTALFGVVKQVLLTPLPYGDPRASPSSGARGRASTRPGSRTTSRRGGRRASRRSPTSGSSPTATSRSTATRPSACASRNIHANVLPILGVRPMLGRNFTAEEDRPNGPRSWSSATRSGSGASAATRRSSAARSRSTGKRATVVGVMPPEFRLPLDFGVRRAHRSVVAAGDGRGSAGRHRRARSSRRAAATTASTPSRGSRPARRPTSRTRSCSALVAELEQWGYMAERAASARSRCRSRSRSRAACARCCSSCSARWGSCCSSPARTSPGCCSCAARRAGASWRCAWRSARARAASRGCCSPRARVLARGCGGALGVALAVLGVRLVRANAPAGLPRVAETTLDRGVLGFALGQRRDRGAARGRAARRCRRRSVAPAGELSEGGRGATAAGRACAGGRRSSRRRSRSPWCSSSARGS